MSTTEAEYIELSELAREAAFVTQLVEAFGFKISPTRLAVDNRGAQSVSYHAELRQRTRHIKVRFHYVRDQVDSGELDVHWVSTRENVAYIFTKGLDESQHHYLADKLLSAIPLEAEKGVPMVRKMVTA